MSGSASIFLINFKAVCLVLAFMLVGALAWPKDTFKIMHPHSGKCLEASKDNEVFIYTCKEVDSQLWRHFNDSRIRSEHSDHCLKNINRDNVRLGACEGEKSIVKTSEFTGQSKGVQFLFKHSDLCLDVWNNTIADGSKLHAFSCRNSLDKENVAQAFRIVADVLNDD